MFFLPSLPFHRTTQKKRDEVVAAASTWTSKQGIKGPGEGGLVGHIAKASGAAFSRLDDGDWHSKVGLLSEVDSSYEARFGEGGYGHRASAVLRSVRGRGFRHEKTKHKRGTYRGGVIDTGSGTSFKFTHSDDEDG